MAQVELNINFQNGLPQSSIQKQIKREFVLSLNQLNINFQNKLPQSSIQKQIARFVQKQESKCLEVNFLIGIPSSSQPKQINRIYSLSNKILTINFEKGLSTVLDRAIWRFVKWTLGGPFNEKYYTIRTIEKPFITVAPLPILPQLRGQAYPDKKRPDYNTIIKRSPSDVAKTYETWHYPRWYIELTYEFLEGNAEGSDYRKLLDFFVARRGNLEDFWYKDPDDNSIENEFIGLGDGNTKSYQLCRTYGGRREPIFAVDKNYEFELKINGIKQLNNSFTITNTGLINFKIAPTESSVITASFHFFYRCRFTEDISEFENFAYKLWHLKSLSMVTTL